MIPVLIPAAGKSSRMRGKDKLLEPVDGVPLLARQIGMAAAVGPVFVALPSMHHARVKLAVQAGATALIVPESSEGLGGTLRGALPQMPDCSAFMVLLPDLVDLTTDDLLAVVAAMETSPAATVWRGATADGKPGHPVIFADSLRAGFATLSGDAGAQPIIADAQVELVPLPGHRARRDLDTPEDWAAWRAGR